jgi:hypothetical protein
MKPHLKPFMHRGCGGLPIFWALDCSPWGAPNSSRNFILPGGACPAPFSRMVLHCPKCRLLVIPRWTEHADGSWAGYTLSVL